MNGRFGVCGGCVGGGGRFCSYRLLRSVAGFTGPGVSNEHNAVILKSSEVLEQFDMNRELLKMKAPIFFYI